MKFFTDNDSELEVIEVDVQQTTNHLLPSKSATMHTQQERQHVPPDAQRQIP